MECAISDSELSIPTLLLKATSLIPNSHYLIALIAFTLTFLYNFLEFHIIRDIIRCFRGDKVHLTFDPASRIYEGVVSKCKVLHGRYLVTPWLASPHFQTTFLNFFGNPPKFCYRRQLYTVHDGGTIALDWLLVSDVAAGSSDTVSVISKDDTTPIAVIVPGLTSDSASPYIRHIVHKMAKEGWNVVVGNHRGLGGIAMTSDCFYNAGWTEDVREVVNYLHQEYPNAPLFAIGTSIGANILVKYLGEEGENTPISGAVSVCSPWDLVVCDRFITRRLVQRFYNKALTIGLKGYAQLHQPILTRLANWDGISNSCSVRDFDHHATRIVAKFETVDTYYRHCGSVNFIEGVSVPLLCISALDDPVCTMEAIPWDECRANKNIVLATLPHGGHLAFFKGITARSLWWVGAVSEFLSVLYASPYMHKQKKLPNTGIHSPLGSSIDRSPYLNVMEDGMIAAITNDVPDNDKATALSEHQIPDDLKPEGVALKDPSEDRNEVNTATNSETSHSPVQNVQEDRIAKVFDDMIGPVKRSINQLSRQNARPMWLLAYIAIVTSWPLLGSALFLIFRKKLKGAVRPAAGSKR